ncbi:MAG: sulfurtransferase-like selenium metabolism protein YedF [Spirochaetaceae bacterium]|jgi:selenium metabolism protein YedF|nr:sulfurtransferase-like selenium metabolism protein YedF [Spirochaetaceae bacterium]
MKTLDMRGQPCPIPVVNAKKALAEQNTEGVVVLVDNIVAVQNLEKMANGTGCGFSYTEDGASQYKVNISRGDMQAFAKTAAGGVVLAGEHRGPVVLITSDSMGRGSEDLGKLLIKGFIFSLSQLEPPPEAVIFLNSGARLTTAGANTVPDLKTLEAKGTFVYTCGTCANFYKLTEALAVGSIVDMMAITNLLAAASGIITI